MCEYAGYRDIAYIIDCLYVVYPLIITFRLEYSCLNGNLFQQQQNALLLVTHDQLAYGCINPFRPTGPFCTPN